MLRIKRLLLRNISKMENTPQFASFIGRALQKGRNSMNQYCVYPLSGNDAVFSK